jgi:hypothetical protein
LAVLLCATHLAAQSGRRPKTTAPDPAPVNTEQKAAPAESPQITSLIITGHDIDPEMKEVWSNDTSIVAKACTERLKKAPPVNLVISYGGKMTKLQAIERAKKATDSYVLWFGYRSTLVGLDYVIDYIDYVVLMPQTAKTLTEGRVDAAKQRATADPGGILRLPKGNKRRPPDSRVLEAAGREIADRVRDVL